MESVPSIEGASAFFSGAFCLLFHYSYYASSLKNPYARRHSGLPELGEIHVLQSPNSRGSGDSELSVHDNPAEPGSDVRDGRMPVQKAPCHMHPEEFQMRGRGPIHSHKGAGRGRARAGSARGEGPREPVFKRSYAASGLIHVLDASGKTNAEGRPEPVWNPEKTIEILESETESG